MRRYALTTAIACILTLSACSSDNAGTPTEPATTTTTVASESRSAAPQSEGRQPGKPIQVDIYVRALADMYASNGQPAPSRAEALEFADSMCGFLDAGNSPYDAVQLLNEEGYPEEYTGDIVPKAIAAACTEHLP
ncbi:DUF732 domain-containing protein [Rhodococcus sp. Chr-9]|uniref:DUF732 domain-containing protein n=1 Tax=Rhodococcus sp. Chr-9 TaxID=713612 RepID=UPI000575D9CE|nr:DUF732 domain-containing protein [Rhodococcus sp. Chr-9]KHJ74685.1 hypothetical protein QR64_00445 [Rhodococcus sp. Chr-9]